MRIVLTGGGAGGHFYPLIAVAEALEDLCQERTVIEPELYYIGSTAFDRQALMEHDITLVNVSAGKMRRYPSILNFLSLLLNMWGIIRATSELFRIYPDVVFSTGGYAAFPTLYAARLLRIPTIIYDADSLPGRVSLWSSRFALGIAIAHPDAVDKFPPKVRDRIARVGHPIRKEIEHPTKEGGYEFLKLNASLPLVFIMGGSQGSVAINEVVVDALANLVTKYNVVHQAGAVNLKDVSNIASVVLKDSQYKDRYKAFGLLNVLALRMTAGAASVIIARAGSGSVFEIASWEKPAILVPIPKDVSHDQTENAFSYARSGAAIVIEQQNLTPHVLEAEIDRIIGDKALQKKMAEAAHLYARPDAARKIATILLDTAISHESV